MAKQTRWGTQGVAALIGDVVGSRRAESREEMQVVLEAALDKVNGQVDALQRLTPTIGDEFQALYRDPFSALSASLLLRLHLLDEVDIRAGIGWGWVSIFHPEQDLISQDGPAWWAARDAIQEVAKSGRQRGTPRGWRTAFSAKYETESLDPSLRREIEKAVSRKSGRGMPVTVFAPDPQELINGYLYCRDEIVSSLDRVDGRIAISLLLGESQADVAKREGWSTSRIAQRTVGKGLHALVQGERSLERAIKWYR